MKKETVEPRKSSASSNVCKFVCEIWDSGVWLLPSKQSLQAHISLCKPEQSSGRVVHSTDVSWKIAVTGLSVTEALDLPSECQCLNREGEEDNEYLYGHLTSLLHHLCLWGNTWYWNTDLQNKNYSHPTQQEKLTVIWQHLCLELRC